MDERARRLPGRRMLMLSGTALVLLLLAACGTGSGGDENATSPAETVTAPTEESVTDLTQQSNQNAAVSSPMAQIATAPASATGAAASPTPKIVVSAPPIVVPTLVPTQPGAPASASPAAAPVGITATAVAGRGASGAVGDGTGGAPMGVPQGAAGTPVPAANGSTVATSCDMPTYPPYTGDAATQVTVSDVNFRAGPGADCDSIGQPLAAGTTVQILSDPVTREGDDQYQWVAVSIDGTEGWLATAFLQPAGE